jgi:hypothetical protein
MKVSTDDDAGMGKKGEPRQCRRIEHRDGLRVTASQTPRNQPPRGMNLMNRIEYKLGRAYTRIRIEALSNTLLANEEGSRMYVIYEDTAGHVDLRDGDANQSISEVSIGKTMIRGLKGIPRQTKNWRGL